MTTTTTLNDLELILLSSASRRVDGHIHPLPKAAGTDMERVGTALVALLGGQLVAEIAVAETRQRWRDQDGQRIGLVITAAGRAAIHDDPDDAEAVAHHTSAEEAPVDTVDTMRSSTKIDTVVQLLGRDQGVSLNELVIETGWLPHTTRAALTGLRKKGYAIVRSKTDGVTRYAIVSAAAG